MLPMQMIAMNGAEDEDLKIYIIREKCDVQETGCKQLFLFYLWTDT